MGVCVIADRDDRALVESPLSLARRGDFAGFEELYRQHVARIHGLCLRMTGDSRRAEDLTQQAFTRAWQKLGSFRGDREFPAWLNRLAVNTVLGDRRSRLRRDPTYNMRLGAAYLKSQLDRYDGSYVLAIAAYNAGPAAVRRWMSLHGDPRSNDLDAIDWIEMIPYRETRNYVQRVLENLMMYRRLIGETKLAYSIRGR